MVEGGERTHSIRMVFRLCQQQSGLFEATLSHTQVRQPDDGGVPPPPHGPVEALGGVHELHLRLGPAAGRDEDAAIVGTAERRDDAAALQHVAGRAHPLLDPGNVVDQFACPEEQAEDRVHRAQVRQLAGTGSRQRLVEERQPFFHPVGHDEHGTEVRARLKLDVGIAEPAANRTRLAQQLLP